MDTDEEPSSLSLTPETETGHGREDIICIVVGLGFPLIFHSLEKPGNIGLMPEKDQGTNEDT
jgi:hypothetical protein